MFRGYRSILIAAGLIALFGASALGQTQEQAEETERGAQQEQRPTQIAPVPLPIEIIKSDAEAETRERHEAESRQREIEDLVAQKGMNEATQAMNRATERMADYALWSTIIAGVAVLLLFGTLILSWMANKAAVAAAVAGTEANAILRVDQRPWLAIERKVECKFTEIENRGILDWSYTIRNHGKTPAMDVRLHTSLVRSHDLLSVGTSVADAVKAGRSVARSPILKRVIFPSETTLPFNARIAKLTEDSGDVYVLAVCATYRGAGIEDLGIEARGFIISRDGNQTGIEQTAKLIEDQGAGIVE